MLPIRSTATMALALGVLNGGACAPQQPTGTSRDAVARVAATGAATEHAPEPKPPPSKPKLDRSDFAALSLWLAQALARRDQATLQDEGFVLGAEPCFPARWLADPAEQAALTVDWALLEFSLAAPNPVAPTVTLNAYIKYSVIVLPDRRTRYFMGDWRGSDGAAPEALRWPPGFVAEMRRFLAAGFGEQCRGADALQEEDIDLDLEQTQQLIVPFIVERVPLRPVCDALRYASPPMPRKGWELQEVRLVALSHGKSGPFVVGAFVAPEREHYRLVAFDPIVHTRPDFEARRGCYEQSGR
jgi:hypothetical protein